MDGAHFPAGFFKCCDPVRICRKNKLEIDFARFLDSRLAGDYTGERMRKDEICWMQARELSRLMRQSHISPVEVVDAFLARIERVNPSVNAFSAVIVEAAREEARAAEAALMRKDRLGLLHGLPFSVKGLMAAQGAPLTRGSRIFSGCVAEEDTPAVSRMRAAGGILIGITNTPEFGWLGVTQNRVSGVTRNPWNRELTSGGSSGGAAAGVVAGMSPLALGSDGGGSIRIPASFCGVFGFKPTYGRVPIHPHGTNWSISHEGPLARTVADTALMMQVLAGYDERDPYALPSDGVDYLKELSAGLRGLRVAWSSNLGYGTVDPEVAAICESAAMRFREFGCELEAANPGWLDPYRVWTTLFYGGFAARVAPLLADHRDDLEPGLVAMTEEVLRWPPERYLRAWVDRLAFLDAARTFFETHDLLVTPTVACPPFQAGREHPAEINGKELAPYRWLELTYPFNLTGQPAATVPCGFTKSGLPVGLQIIGRRFSDAQVLAVAYQFEQAYPWYLKRPVLA